MREYCSTGMVSLQHACKVGVILCHISKIILEVSIQIGMASKSQALFGEFLNPTEINVFSALLANVDFCAAKGMLHTKYLGRVTEYCERPIMGKCPCDESIQLRVDLTSPLSSSTISCHSLSSD
ncbi:unnamed protein product [Boreogadus saida]